MAKQAGPFYIEGRFNKIVFYRLGENYYVRIKSSLDGKRVKKDVAFAGTMRQAEFLGRASKMASVIYKQIPTEARTKNLYKTITGQVMRLLKEGVKENDVRSYLRWG